jgi:hypothetical protein
MSKTKKTTIEAPAKSGSAWTKQDIKDLKTLVKSGNSCKEIAQGLQRSIPSIWTRMSAMGLKVKRKTNKK